MNWWMKPQWILGGLLDNGCLFEETVALTDRLGSNRGTDSKQSTNCYLQWQQRSLIKFTAANWEAQTQKRDYQRATFMTATAKWVWAENVLFLLPIWGPIHSCHAERDWPPHTHSSARLTASTWPSAQTHSAEEQPDDSCSHYTHTHGKPHALLTQIIQTGTKIWHLNIWSLWHQTTALFAEDSWEPHRDHS